MCVVGAETVTIPRGNGRVEAEPRALICRRKQDDAWRVARTRRQLRIRAPERACVLEGAKQSRACLVAEAHADLDKYVPMEWLDRE
jgi:hypothetical protein